MNNTKLLAFIKLGNVGKDEIAPFTSFVCNDKKIQTKKVYIYLKRNSL